MLRRRTVGFLIAAACLLVACVSDETTTAGPGSLELADSNTNPLEVPEGTFIENEAKDRSAILTILKGDVDRGEPAPYRAELVQSIDAEVYRDTDSGTGPEFWLMEASVEDADGNVLWRDRENGLFQLLEFLQVILEEQDIPLTAFQVFDFVRQQYPQLLEFAVRVPTGIEGGQDYVLKMPDEEGEYYEVIRLSIADLVANATPPETEAEVETIYESAPPADALDIVILGDGYPTEDREKFALDAQAVGEALLEAEPFSTHAQSVNVHTVFTPSAERGAGYDCTGNPLVDGSCKDGLRDNQFGTVFVITALADILNIDIGDLSDRVAMPIEVRRLYDAASLANYDEIVLISNTRRRSGFAGLYISVVTSFDRDRVQFPDVAVHELGHSFGVLGDEYEVRGDPCLFNEPRVPLPPNIAQFAMEEIKWERWFMGPTPVPTPIDEADEYPVGAYEGAYNCDFLYRPAANCKMNSDENLPFCPICREQVSRRMYSVIDPLRSQSATVERRGESLVFELPVYEDWEDRFEIRWTLGEEEIGDLPTLELNVDKLPASPEWLPLTAAVRDSTGHVVIDDPNLTSEIRWFVRRR